MAQHEIPDLDIDPEYAARWRAGLRTTYLSELRRLAEKAGLLDSPVMQEKIAWAEAEARDAQAEARKYHLEDA